MNNNQTPNPGDLYRHFKGNLYQIITVAIHTETEEPLVIYQALYGDYRTYARPLLMFLEEVDKAKYPDVNQIYRFEKINRESLKDAENNENRQSQIEKQLAEYKNEVYTELRVEPENELGLVNKDLLAFLDADSYEEKLEILYTIRNEMDDRLMTNIEMSLDLSGHEGTIDDRFDYVKNNLQTLSKFESKRLR